MEKGERRAPNVNADRRRQFVGSWSGYERDCFFYNPDGPYPRFFDTSYVFGLDFDDDGRAGAPVDIDGDGDLDLALLSLQGLRLMLNNSPQKHFARVHLTAVHTEAQALGALVRLRAGTVTQQDYARMTDGFLSQVPLDLHFGLGDQTRIDEISVTWPSGKVETWKDLPVDRLIALTEGKPDFVATELSRWPDDARPKVRPAFSFDIAVEGVEGGKSPVAAPGKPVVLNFWAPWCAPCKEELPSLVRLYGKFGAEAQFAGVSVETKDRESVKKAIADFGLAYPQFLADDSLLRSFFGSDGQATLPSTFVFDGKARLRRVFRRALTETELSALLESFRDEGTFLIDLRQRAGEARLRLQFPEAIEIYRKILEMDPSLVLERINLATCLGALKRNTEAEAEFLTVIRLDPRHAVAHLNLGILRRAMGRPMEAIGSIEEALRIEGEDASRLVMLGGAAAEAGDYQKALNAFDRALKVDAKTLDAWAGKGKVYMLMKQPAEARACFESALKIDPNHADSKKNLMMLKR